MDPGRWRVARQHLTESLVLAVLGGAAGVGFAYGGMRIMSQFPLPPSAGHLDARLLGFAFATSLLTGILFGAVPAMRAVQIDPVRALKESGCAGTSRRNYTRSTLVALQIALSLALLVGADLFVRSLGAPIRSVVFLVARQGLVPVALGVVAGLLTAVAGTRYIQSLLYGTDAKDLASFGAASAILVAVAVLAVMLPAFRAARIDPMIALRNE